MNASRIRSGDLYVAGRFNPEGMLPRPILRGGTVQDLVPAGNRIGGGGLEVAALNVPRSGSDCGEARSTNAGEISGQTIARWDGMGGRPWSD